MSTVVVERVDGPDVVVQITERETVVVISAGPQGPPGEVSQAEFDELEGTRGQVKTGTATPTLASLGNGDTYFQLDGSGNVIAEWVKTSA